MNRIPFTLIKIFVAIILLWFLAHTSKLDFSLLLNLLGSPFLLISTSSLYFITVAISSWRWQQLNNAQQIKLSYPHTLLPTYLGIAFNNLLPGGVGGDFFRFYFINKKIPTKKSVVMLSILLDRITGLSGIFIIVCMMAAFHLPSLMTQTVTLYFLLFCLSICLFGVLLYFAASFLPKQIGLSLWLIRKFTGKKWLQPILSLLDALKIYRESKKIMLECLIASVIIQFLIAVTCMLIAKMMQFPTLPFYDFIMAIAVTQIVNLIPVTPGGFGIGEMAFANVLLLLNPGLNMTYATIFLAYRIIGILLYLPGIAVFIFDDQLLKHQHTFKNEATN